MAHDKAWPDKCMFAALTLLLGGFLGILFSLVQLSGATIDESRIPDVLLLVPPGIALVLSAITAILGYLSLRHQASVWGYAGAGTAILSGGFLGLVPVLALVAVFNLVLSRMEGEETVHDGRLMDQSQWPDKAMAASLFLMVLALVAALQAVAIYTGRWTVETVLPSYPWVVGTYCAGAALIAGLASARVYRQRSAWLGWLGAGLGFATFAFYLLAPILALVAAMFLMKAHKEDEFVVPV